MRRIQLAACSVLVLSAIVAFTTPGAAAETPPAIQARNAILVDAESGQILYEKQATTRVAPASLTKLFTAFLALELAPLNRMLAVDSNDLVGESSADLQPGETLTLEEMLYALILPSGNDAAMSIARNLGENTQGSDQNAVGQFLETANARFEALGLQNTNLENPHGLDQLNHYSSARDIAALTMYAMQHQPIFTQVLGTPATQITGHTYTHTNQMSERYTGVIGGKTGTTDNAGKCLVEVVQQNGRTLIAVVMGSTESAWYDDAISLFDYGLLPATTTATSQPFGQIVFADQMPAVNADVNQFKVVSNGAATYVSVSASPNTSVWPLIKWPLIALLASLVLLVCCGQYFAMQRLRLSRSSRRRADPKPASRIPDLSQSDRRLDETLPLHFGTSPTPRQSVFSGD